MNKTQYTTDFFLEMLGRIPESEWNVGHFLASYDQSGKFQHCVLGFCGMGIVIGKDLQAFACGIDAYQTLDRPLKRPEMAQALVDLFEKYLGIDPAQANNNNSMGLIHFNRSVHGPKARVMYCLEAIKVMEQREDERNAKAVDELLKEVSAMGDDDDTIPTPSPLPPELEEVEAPAEAEDPVPALT